MLVCRVQGRLCALPVAHVVETMRPLPVEPLGATAPFVKGLSLIRGAPVPVVDAATLLGSEASSPASRFVVIRAGDRRVALAVEAVVGIRDIPAASLQSLPPLLRASGAATVAEVGALDAELLVVLGASRLLPDETWDALRDAQERR
jgi:purine-binding chemotaxis protein CheW